MDTYTVEGMTEKEVKRLGESRWFYLHKWKLLLQLIIPLIVALILEYVLPSPYKAISLVAIIFFLIFYLLWWNNSGKAGRELFKSIKEGK